MNDKKRNNELKGTAWEITQVAVFVALVIGGQFALSFLPVGEIVTLLFVTYSFSFGIRRGVMAATVFSLLRQLIFGFYPTVLVEYLLYYNGLAVCFGLLGEKIKRPAKHLWWLTGLACVGTVAFVMLDNLVTPLWYGLTKEGARAYFIASLPLLFPQILSTALTVGVLFLPLWKAFCLIKRKTP